MKNKILHLWSKARGSFWFVPTVMTFCAIALSILFLSIDMFELAYKDLKGWWLYTGGPDGARLVLSTIAGSMITVAGVVFSITIVVLSLTSSQFGPRLIRNFMDDRAKQMVLGTFIATFIYCLFVLQNIRDIGDQYFVPYVSVTFGIVLAAASIGVLIYFIHDISTSIQANNITARVCRDLDKVIELEFPERIDSGRSENDREYRDELVENDGYAAEKYYTDIVAVSSNRSGYLQDLDVDGLKKAATGHDVIVRLENRPGDFILENGTLFWVWPGERTNPDLEKKLRSFFVIGRERTSSQDVEYAVRLLVEIAVRALSPGVNDPFTAITCVDRLGEALGKIARRKLPGPFCYDDKNNLRLILKNFRFSGIADAAFNQIRQNAAQIPSVSIRLLEIVGALARIVDGEEDGGKDNKGESKKQTLKRHASMVYRSCAGHFESAGVKEDMQDLERRYFEVLDVLSDGRADRRGESILGVRYEDPGKDATDGRSEFGK
jgi:uncharacterized membrane protein